MVPNTELNITFRKMWNCFFLYEIHYSINLCFI